MQKPVISSLILELYNCPFKKTIDVSFLRHPAFQINLKHEQNEHL